eukprot:6628106-Karenia_brevis.AAC.1
MGQHFWSKWTNSAKDYQSQGAQAIGQQGDMPSNAAGLNTSHRANQDHRSISKPAASSGPPTRARGQVVRLSQ